jgi:hypothetical protein
MGNCCGAPKKKALTLQCPTGINKPTDKQLTEVRATSADNSTASLKADEFQEAVGPTHSRAVPTVYQELRRSREARGSLKEETGREITWTNRSTVNIEGCSQPLRSLAAGSELLPDRVVQIPRKLEKVEASSLQYNEIEVEIIDPGQNDRLPAASAIERPAGLLKQEAQLKQDSYQPDCCQSRDLQPWQQCSPKLNCQSKDLQPIQDSYQPDSKPVSSRYLIKLLPLEPQPSASAGKENKHFNSRVAGSTHLTTLRDRIVQFRQRLDKTLVQASPALLKASPVPKPISRNVSGNDESFVSYISSIDLKSARAL